MPGFGCGGEYQGSRGKDIDGAYNYYQFDCQMGDFALLMP